jgi:membrane protein implicated in regulation of membrane protease activity
MEKTFMSLLFVACSMVALAEIFGCSIKVVFFVLYLLVLVAIGIYVTRSYFRQHKEEKRYGEQVVN